MFLGVVAAVSLSFGAGVAAGQASYISGNDLYRDCTAPQSDSTYYQLTASCTSYILGVNDAFVTGSIVAGLVRAEETSSTMEMLCVPVGVEAGQLRDIVVSHLRNNPAERHESASLQVLIALRTQYPCA